jgi:NADPH:quinone reductase-like Zn-dependent oxidoreductase
MRALRYDRFGPVAEVARWTEVPDPVPAAGEVRVRVAWAAINPLDWKLVEGQFRLLAKGKPPCGIGAEFSGIVDAVGAGVTQVATGARVVGFLDPFKRAPGALQALAAVAADDVIVVPEALSLDAACTLPVAGQSALQMCRAAGVRAGQRVLVHGAAGGVGSFAVQLVRVLGASVTATGSGASQAFIAGLHPDAQVDYTRQPPARWGGPFDAVLDCASTLNAQDLEALLTPRGRYVSSLPKFPNLLLDPLLNPFRRRKKHMLRLEPSRADLARLLQWLAGGSVVAHIGGRFDAADAVRALEQSKSGRARGKLVVRLSHDT